MGNRVSSQLPLPGAAGGFCLVGAVRSSTRNPLVRWEIYRRLYPQITGQEWTTASLRHVTGVLTSWNDCLSRQNGPAAVTGVLRRAELGQTGKVMIR
jgi:hypothetical protein